LPSCNSENRSSRPRAVLPAADRIRSRRDYLRVQSEGRRVHTPHFVLMVMPAERKRLGITVTRKVAGAVGRNRVKRLVREAFRLNRELFPEACEVVVVARTGAQRLDYAAVCQELRDAENALGRASRPRTSPRSPEPAP
jgi:ribonuclease P protein component